MIQEFKKLALWRTGEMIINPFVMPGTGIFPNATVHQTRI
jgi:hypothetical protein